MGETEKKPTESGARMTEAERKPTETGAKMTEAERKPTETEQKMLEYARKQFYMTAVAAVSCLALFAVVFAASLTLVPRAKKAMDQIQVAAEELQQVSAELSEAELGALVEHVDQMAVTSEAGVKEALEKIESIDIDELNRAIKSLSEVVSPLAKVMGIFH